MSSVFRAIFLVVLLSSVCAMAKTGNKTEEKARGLMLTAYDMVLEADAKFAQGNDLEGTEELYYDALKRYLAIEKISPDWLTFVIEYRIAYCNDKINALRKKRGVTKKQEPKDEIRSTLEGKETIEQIEQLLNMRNTELAEVKNELDTATKKLEDEMKSHAAAKEALEQEKINSAETKEQLAQMEGIKLELASATRKLDDEMKSHAAAKEALEQEKMISAAAKEKLAQMEGIKLELASTTRKLDDEMKSHAADRDKLDKLDQQWHENSSQGYISVAELNKIVEPVRKKIEELKALFKEAKTAEEKAKVAEEYVAFVQTLNKQLKFEDLHLAGTGIDTIIIDVRDESNPVIYKNGKPSNDPLMPVVKPYNNK